MWNSLEKFNLHSFSPPVNHVESASASSSDGSNLIIIFANSASSIFTPVRSHSESDFAQEEHVRLQQYVPLEHNEPSITI